MQRGDTVIDQYNLQRRPWSLFLGLYLYHNGASCSQVTPERHETQRKISFLYILNICLSLVRSLVAYPEQCFTTSKYAKTVIKWRAAQNICLQKHLNLWRLFLETNKTKENSTFCFFKTARRARNNKSDKTRQAKVKADSLKRKLCKVLSEVKCNERILSTRGRPKLS